MKSESEIIARIAGYEHHLKNTPVTEEQRHFICARIGILKWVLSPPELHQPYTQVPGAGGYANQ
jgi:hypothetical protein